MSRRIFSITGLIFLATTIAGEAQEAPNSSEPAVAAASRTEAECSGFIAGSRLPDDLWVADGADNDFHSSVRQFITGEYVYLHGRSGAGLSFGAEYALVRPADELFRTSWYGGQRWAIRSLGTPYEDLARVKVIKVTQQGAVAEVAFSCGPVYPGDLAIPYQARAIPVYTPSKQFDRFAAPNGKLVGAITAARNNAASVGKGTLTYINLGGPDGVRPGQRFRIFSIPREQRGWWLSYPETPRESVGEMIILSTHERSSVGIVVSCTRNISLGDGVELE